MVAQSRAERGPGQGARAKAKAKTAKASAKKTGNGHAKPDAFAHPIEAFTPEQIAERFGGGLVDDKGICVRGPGHNAGDDSLRIFLNPALPDGFWTHSFAGDDPAKCRVYVLKTLGIAAGKQTPLSPEQEAEREAAHKEIAEKLAAMRAEKLAKWIATWAKAHPVTAADTDPAWKSGQGNTKPWALANKYLAGRGLQILDDTVFRWRNRFYFKSSNAERPGAMLAQIVEPLTGDVVGIHETFINEFGEKTTVEMPHGEDCEHKSRLSHGSSKGVIWLYRGKPGTKVACLGEGVETALSLGLIPEAAGAAIISFVNVGNLDKLPIMPDFDIVFVAVDLEPSGAGKKHAETFAARAAKEGKIVRLVYPTIPLVKSKADLNNVIQVEGYKVGEHYKIVEVSSGPAREAPADDSEPSDANYEAQFVGDEQTPPEYSEAALANVFNATYGERVRYVKAWGQWRVYNGKIWKEDQTQRVYSYARKVCIRAAAALDDSKGAQTLARKITSANGIAAVVKIAQSLPRIAATSDQWDTDVWALNTPKGVVDLRTGKLRPHRAEDYMTKCTAVSPGGHCPRFLKFLGEITNDDAELIAYLQRKGGYGLTGVTTEHAVFFTHGKGRNGKSVYLNTIGWAMGDYCEVAPITTFIVTNFEQHPTDLADLRGARMVRCSEVAKGQRWAEEKIKQMSGGDPIKARFMRQDFFTYQPQFKLEFIGNVKPSLRTVDEAAKARFQMIPFEVFIKPENRDHNLETILREEGPGILQWMIDGCLEWQRIGLAPPPSVIAASEEYIHQQDVTEQWLEECCERGTDKPSTITRLWQSWKCWADNAGEFVGTRKDLVQRLKDKGFEEFKTADGMCFRGLRVKPEEGPRCAKTF